MIAMSPEKWAIICLLAILYLLSCAHVAHAMRRSGRSGLKWFFLTLVLTAIPATIVLSVERFRALRPPPGQADDRVRSRRDRAGKITEQPSQEPPRRGRPRRCPHCQAVLDPTAQAGADGLRHCPRCGQAFEEAHLA